ncbi:hypothetical protein [Chryseobacterium sp.]|uniref:hypothetical protein n=1 Tax=Chryseobacterium sp. TaxID=1871047 RepID=UPI00388EE674
MSKSYNIKGVDLKSELILGFSILPFIIIGSAISVYTYHNVMHYDYKNIPFTIVLGGLIFGSSIGLLIINFLGKKISSTWKIKFSDEDISIDFKNKKWRFTLNEVTKLKIYGIQNFKYVSFWLNNKDCIKLRIGNSGLTPFSDKEDLKILDNFLKDLLPYFENKYLKIDKLKKISPPGTIKLTYIKTFS